MRNKKKSYNMTMNDMRSQRSLEHYQKYQHIWMKNIEEYDTARQRHNSPVYSKNSKFNQFQHEKGDITIQDRADQLLENKKNKELLQIALRPNLDSNVNWLCSLRQDEHDNEFDGMKEMAIAKGEQDEKPHVSNLRDNRPPDDASEGETLGLAESMAHLTNREALNSI